MNSALQQEKHWQSLNASGPLLFLLATRPKFFTASVLPVLLGTAWAYPSTDQIDWISFGLAILAILCVHACINVLNDVYDDLNGTDLQNTDRIFPFSGGSRFIQEDVISRQNMHRWGLALGAAAIVLGLVLILREGVPVLWLGLAGLGLGVFYSATPVVLSARGLGELAVGIGAGLLPVIGAAWLQTHQWDNQAFLLAIPISIWVTCILLINEIPDRKADAAVGKNTLVVRLGPRHAMSLHVVLNLLALISIGYMAATGILATYVLILPTVLFVLLLLILLKSSDFATSRDAMTRIIKHTLATHMLGGLWLSASILI